MLGAFDDALGAYRPVDFALGGDALLALGRLRPLLDVPHVAAPWQALWQAYRAHALCLAGRADEALALARSLVPVDVYEWIHVFECLLRLGELTALDLRSVLFRPAGAGGHRWADLARRRMRADYLRQTREDRGAELGPEYEELLAEYDRAGLPLERALTRASYTAWLLAHDQLDAASAINEVALALARQSSLRVLEADAWSVAREIALRRGEEAQAREAARREEHARAACGLGGPCRP
jgi:hypothetical protein